jgi:hypothetical protein
VKGQWLQKVGVFGIEPEDSSLMMALDEMHVALALLLELRLEDDRP